jgi:hypothetical protein
MKEVQFDKGMCIHQIHHSLSNDCQMKKEFDSVMCNPGNQRAGKTECTTFSTDGGISIRESDVRRENLPIFLK